LITAKEKKISEGLDWFIHIAVAVVVGVLVVLFIGQRTIVFDVSMQPTLVEKDNLLVEKLSIRFGGLKRGDIIVFKSPQEERNLVKRLVALEGDTVEIKDGKLYVNNKVFLTGLAKEPVTAPGSVPEYSKLTIPKGCAYALGDNRTQSYDCRELGPIKMSWIKGRAIFRFYPFGKFGKLG
jgi:signal peptidase I